MSADMYPRVLKELVNVVAKPLFTRYEKDLKSPGIQAKSLVTGKMEQSSH